MFDRHDALELFEYDRWATGRIAEKLAGLAQPHAQAERILAHVVGALEVWHARVAGGESKPLAVWPEGVALAQLRARFEAVSGAWRARLERADANELARRVEFKNSKGEVCADRLDDILRHIVNHGTHHRGQIAQLLRVAGELPETLDFIVWRRQQRAASAPRKPAWKQFVIESRYLADLARIDEKLLAHRAHLETGFQSGMLLASGPQVPRSGGMILARARERREIEEFLARDPFVLAGISEYRVVEFEPVKQAPSFAGWAMGE
ncbi:MAG: DinB family protein [Planctomycetes bacterium]|nr:DinB family protein [Planctomycetota bacterium]